MVSINGSSKEPFAKQVLCFSLVRNEADPMPASLKNARQNQGIIAPIIPYCALVENTSIQWGIESIKCSALELE